MLSAGVVSSDLPNQALMRRLQIGGDRKLGSRRSVLEPENLRPQQRVNASGLLLRVELLSFSACAIVRFATPSRFGSGCDASSLESASLWPKAPSRNARRKIRLPGLGDAGEGELKLLSEVASRASMLIRARGSELRRESSCRRRAPVE